MPRIRNELKVDTNKNMKNEQRIYDAMYEYMASERKVEDWKATLFKLLAIEAMEPETSPAERKAIAKVLEIINQ